MPCSDPTLRWSFTCHSDPRADCARRTRVNGGARVTGDQACLFFFGGACQLTPLFSQVFRQRLVYDHTLRQLQVRCAHGVIAALRFASKLNHELHIRRALHVATAASAVLSQHAIHPALRRSLPRTTRRLLKGVRPNPPSSTLPHDPSTQMVLRYWDQRGRTALSICVQKGSAPTPACRMDRLVQ